MAEHSTDASQHSAWIRLLYLVLYAVIFYVAEAVVMIAAVVQFIFHLFTGQPNPRLAELGGGLSLFMAQIVSFLTYRNNRLPFPFGEWPKVSEKSG